jgi:hypothetical protein
MNNRIEIPLEDVRVAQPCHASWDKMDGDGTARFCQSCHKNVYNLSEMTRQQAEALIAEKEGNLCVRYYRRADGTVMTDDCPVGLRLIRKPYKWLLAGAACVFAWGSSLAYAVTRNQPEPEAGNGAPVRRFSPADFEIGDVALPLPEPTPTAEPTPTPSATPTPEPTAEPTPPPIVIMGLVAPARDGATGAARSE